MKKRKKSKLLLLLLTMTLTIALLGTTSYAWFTENRNVSVAPIQVNIAATGGIQVSENAINWRSLVDNSLLLTPTGYTGHANQIPTELSPVSSALTTTAGRLNMYSGSVVSDGSTGYNLVTVKSNEAPGTDGAFIAFDLFFRYEAEAANPGNIYLTTSSGVAAFGDDSGIKNAARIAFVPLGNTPISAATPAATIQSYATAGTVRMWEPNFDSHTANAILHASSTYNMTGVANSDGVLRAYSGTNAATTVPVADATAALHPTEFIAVAPIIYTANGFTARPIAFNLTPANITKMRVYMWVEGQDIDCENAASGATITFNLQFSLDAS